MTMTVQNGLQTILMRDKIKFELVSKGTGLEFLGVKVHLNNGYLVPEIHSKETDSHEYLNPDSVHPPSVWDQKCTKKDAC